MVGTASGIPCSASAGGLRVAVVSAFEALSAPGVGGAVPELAGNFKPAKKEQLG